MVLNFSVHKKDDKHPGTKLEIDIEMYLVQPKLISSATFTRFDLKVMSHNVSRLS